MLADVSSLYSYFAWVVLRCFGGVIRGLRDALGGLRFLVLGGRFRVGLGPWLIFDVRGIVLRLFCWRVFVLLGGLFFHGLLLRGDGCSVWGGNEPMVLDLLEEWEEEWVRRLPIENWMVGGREMLDYELLGSWTRCRGQERCLTS